MTDRSLLPEIRLSPQIKNLADWYDVEWDGLRTFRWSKERSKISVEQDPRFQYLILYIGTPDIGRQRVVTLRGRGNYRIELREGWHRYSVPLAEILEYHGEVEIETCPTFEPDGDPRSLGVMVSEILLSVDKEESLFPYEIHACSVNGVEFRVRDHAGSVGVAKSLEVLIEDGYRLNEIAFADGDAVVEIGAHVGTVSLYLAKKNPFVQVYAFEPLYANYVMLRKNIEDNRVNNIVAHRVAVTRDRREIDISAHLESNSAAATAYSSFSKSPGRYTSKAFSLTIDDIFESFLIDRCKALIIDCQGCEYEALLSSAELDRVEHLGIEIHENECIRSLGWSAEGLKEHIFTYFRPDRVGWEVKQTAD